MNNWSNILQTFDSLPNRVQENQKMAAIHWTSKDWSTPSVATKLLIHWLSLVFLQLQIELKAFRVTKGPSNQLFSKNCSDLFEAAPTLTLERRSPTPVSSPTNLNQMARFPHQPSFSSAEAWERDIHLIVWEELHIKVAGYQLLRITALEEVLQKFSQSMFRWWKETQILEYKKQIHIISVRGIFNVPYFTLTVHYQIIQHTNNWLKGAVICVFQPHNIILKNSQVNMLPLVVI